MSRNIKNAAIIGCGQIGALYDMKNDNLILTHAKGYQLSSQTQLIYVVDINKSIAKTVAKEYQCQYILNYKKLPLKELDIVSICVDTDYHFNILEYLYNSKYQGIIILEKPIISTKSELLQLKTFHKSFLDRIYINYIRRFDKTYIKILNSLKLGVYSKIEKIDIHYFGKFQHNAIHALNITNFLFNKNPILLYKDESITLLQYNTTHVAFNKLKTNYHNYDITIYTQTHKIVFDKLGYRVKIFKKIKSEKFNKIQELQLQNKKDVLNGYIKNMFQNIFNINTFPTVYEGINDIELIFRLNLEDRDSE